MRRDRFDAWTNVEPALLAKSDTDFKRGVPVESQIEKRGRKIGLGNGLEGV